LGTAADLPSSALEPNGVPFDDTLGATIVGRALDQEKRMMHQAKDAYATWLNGYDGKFSGKCGIPKFVYTDGQMPGGIMADTMMSALSVAIVKAIPAEIDGADTGDAASTNNPCGRTDARADTLQNKLRDAVHTARAKALTTKHKVARREFKDKAKELEIAHHDIAWIVNMMGETKTSYDEAYATQSLESDEGYDLPDRK
jgi:hypothetical protein